MLLIQNAYIKPITGPDIPNGCLLADGGRIAAIAPHIDPPEGCTVIDAGGRLLTPAVWRPTATSAWTTSACAGRAWTTTRWWSL